MNGEIVVVDLKHISSVEIFQDMIKQHKNKKIVALSPYSFYVLDNLNLEYETLHNFISKKLFRDRVLNNINLIEGLKLYETATTNQKTAAQVLIDLADKAGFNIALASIIFDGSNNYALEGEALSDNDVISYLNRIRKTEIFDKVILEKSFIAVEGSNIKSFVINISVLSELMNAKNLKAQDLESKALEGEEE